MVALLPQASGWAGSSEPNRVGTAMLVSLYDDARREADCYKWLESERHGRDLGEPAVHEWYHRFWPHYCRHRRLEHIRGKRCWQEFGDETFGCLYSLIVAGDPLTGLLFDQIDAGAENLDIINWALERNEPMDRVIDILAQIDVNRARLEPRV